MTTTSDIGADETPATTTRVVDKAQYGLAAFIVLVGGYVLVDASGLTKGFADQPVQPYAVPYVVGTITVLLGLALALATWRGDVPESEGGEDVDLTQSSDWVTVAKLVAVFVANLLLVDPLGWVVSGTILFAGAAWALGSRTPIKDVAIGLGLSLLTWYGFYVGLGLPIPAGILDGVL